MVWSSLLGRPYSSLGGYTVIHYFLQRAAQHHGFQAAEPSPCHGIQAADVPHPHRFILAPVPTPASCHSLVPNPVPWVLFPAPQWLKAQGLPRDYSISALALSINCGCASNQSQVSRISSWAPATSISLRGPTTSVSFWVFSLQTSSASPWGSSPQTFSASLWVSYPHIYSTSSWVFYPQTPVLLRGFLRRKVLALLRWFLRQRPLEILLLRLWYAAFKPLCRWPLAVLCHRFY